MSSPKVEIPSLEIYNFWVWQYTARNPEFLKNRDLLVKTVRMLEETGIMSKHVSLAEVINESLWEVRPGPKTVLGQVNPVENGWAPRKPTAEEREVARQAIGLHAFFSALCYDYPDISMEAVPAEYILSSAASYIVEHAFPRKQVYASSYPFTSHRSLLDTTPLPGLFQTFVGTGEGGKRKLMIDFNLPLDIILCQIRAIYELSHGPQGPSTEQAIRIIAKSHGDLTKFQEEPRIIGLWLWDYLQTQGGRSRRGVVQQAVNTVRKRLKDLNGNLKYYHGSHDRVLQSFLKQTEACVEACKVMPFK